MNVRRLAFALACCAAVHADQPPEQTAKTIQCPPGFAATVFAAEPMVVNPTNMEIDSRGRVWVTEGLNYRFFANKNYQRVPGADKIKILEDTDGDGRADKVTVFAENIYPVPMGLAIQEKWENGKYKGCRVFTGNSPDLLVFEDTDGDDKADKKEVLLTGFGGYDHDHGVHGMFLALDGKLYFTKGDGRNGSKAQPIPGNVCMHVTDKSGRTITHNKDGSVLRCDLDGKNLELLATGLRNNYEVTVDSFGDIFASDNDDDGNRGVRTCWILPGAHYGYKTPGSPRHWGEEVPGNMPKLVGTGNGSPCGILVYEGKLFPKEVHGAVLQIDAGTRQINLHPLTRHGAGWRTEYKTLIKGNGDAQFRPVDACVEHDGAILVADWYDAGVGGHRFTDQKTGRVYRIAPAGHKSVKPTPDFGTPKGLASALLSPNQTTAVASAAVLRERSGVADALAKSLASASECDSVRLLGVLQQIRDKMLTSEGARAFGEGVAAASARTREANTKLLVSRDPDFADEAMIDPLVANLRITTNLKASLFAYGKAASAKSFSTTAMEWDGNDRSYLELIRLAAAKLPSGSLQNAFDELLGIALAEAPATGPIPLPPYYPTGANDAFLLPGDKDIPATTASKLIGLAWVLERPEALPALQALASRNTNPEVQRGIEMAISRIKDERAAFVLAELVAKPGADANSARGALAALAGRLGKEWTKLRGDAKIDAAFRAAWAAEGMRVAAIKAIGAAGLASFAGDLMKSAAGTGDLAERAAALEALGRLKHAPAKALAQKLVDDAAGKPLAPPLAGPALAALADLAGNDGPALLEQVLADAKQPESLRRSALQTLLRDDKGGMRLLNLHKQGQLAAALLPEAAFQLNNHHDRQVRRRAEKEMPLPKANGRTVGDVSKLLALRADAGAGAKVFQLSSAGSAACGSCHRVQGVGQWVGPDLSAIGVKYEAKELLYHILTPSGAIAHGYQTTTLRTDDGKTLAGLVVDETADRLTLKTARNERLALAKANIEQRAESPISVMPEKLADPLSDQQLADLLAYLGTLRQPVAEAGAALVAAPFAMPAAGVVPTFDGKSVTVKASRDGWLDLSGLLPAQPDAGALAIVEYQSPIDQTATLTLVSRAPLAAWVQGEPVALKQTGDAWSGPVKLTKAGGKLFVRVAGGAAEPGLSITVVAPQPVRLGSR